MYHLLSKNPLADLTIKDHVGNVAANYLDMGSTSGIGLSASSGSGPNSPK